MADANLATIVHSLPIEPGRHARVWIMEPDGRVRISRLHRLSPRRLWWLIRSTLQSTAPSSYDG